MTSKIIYSLGISLFAVGTFCDASGALCPKLLTARYAMEHGYGKMEEAPRVQWTQSEREKHIASIVAQMEATQTVLQQRELTPQQIVDSENQIEQMLVWLREMLHWSSHVEWNDDHYTIAPLNTAFVDTRWGRNASFLKWLLGLRKKELGWERQKLNEIDLGQDSKGESLNTQAERVLDGIENMLKNIEDVLPPTQGQPSIH